MSRPNIVLAFVLALAFGATATPSLASTVIGNGGDVVERYLEATRYTLGQVNAKITAGVDVQTLCTCADAQAKDNLCTTLRSLSADQQAFCRTVITQTAAAVTALNVGPGVVPLTVSAAPLYVAGPDGHEQEVAAQTELGPAGPIVFSESAVRTISPMDLLALMSRAFHQKTAFPAAGQYISDNAAVGPFAKAGGGRQLLDAVGAALSWYAYEHGLVGREFQIDDSYSCEVQETTTGLDFSSLGASVRVFQDANAMQTYETGVGNWPSDLQCSLKENATSQLFFRVQIHEEADCASPAGDATRYTDLEIWRLTTGASGSAPVQTQLVARTLKGVNPICAQPGAAPTPLTLSYADGARNYVFTVQYQGSTGRLIPDQTANQN